LQAVDVRSFRTDPVAAQLVSSIIELRSIEVDSVPLSGPVEKIQESSTANHKNVFRIKHRSKDPYTYVPSSFYQRVKSVDPRTVEVEVQVASFKRDPDLFGFDALAPENHDHYLLNSDFIPCDSPQILKLAKALEKESANGLSEESSILDKVNACRVGLSKRLVTKEFDKQISPLPTVLRSNSANCIEHAILMTSLCRSLKIPARLSIGYQYNRKEAEPKMQAHVWIEALVDNVWIPFDSSMSDFPTSIDRIKIADADFNGANPYTEVIRSIQMMADIEISIVAPADADETSPQ
jgi:transglutaminase-like putative cysteine protease